MAHVHFVLDELLIDEAIGRDFARGQAEIRLFAVFEGREPEAQIDFTVRDYFIAHGDGDSVYDHRERSTVPTPHMDRRNRPSYLHGDKAEYREKCAHQKACPMEKKN